MPIIIKPSQLEESVKLGAQFRHCIHEEPEIGLYLPDFSQVCERSSQWCELRYSQVQTAH